MAQAEYMKAKYKRITDDIKDQYNLHEKVTSNYYIYIKIKKGMYDLKQATIFANNSLQANIRSFGYAPVIDTVGIW